MLGWFEGGLMNAPFDTATIGDIVANDYRAAAIFEDFGIDFCCGGRRSFADACALASADPDALMDALRALAPDAAAGAEAISWPMDRLIDHIVNVHHAFVRDALPRIADHLAKLVAVHGERHPELSRVMATYETVSDELMQHMMKEEQILFPYVRDLAAQQSKADASIVSPFGTVENPIRMMEREHRDAADGLGDIRDLTRDYTAPDDGCQTYRVTMEELAAFERDLHRHVHLENNVLFPRAIAMERQRA
jgi:regulator of cell morphogenesis and NO signaling